MPLLNEDRPVAHALRSALAQRRRACPVRPPSRAALLRPEAEREGYVERAIGRKRRKELRRQRHRLADTGPLSFMMRDGSRDVASALDDFLALEAGGWKGRAGTAIAQHHDIRRFVESAVVALAGSGQVRIARLACGSRPIACALDSRERRGRLGLENRL